MGQSTKNSEFRNTRGIQHFTEGKGLQIGSFKAKKTGKTFFIATANLDSSRAFISEEAVKSLNEGRGKSLVISDFDQEVIQEDGTVKIVPAMMIHRTNLGDNVQAFDDI